MLCYCSGEQFKFEEPAPQSPESLATRDFSASGVLSRNGTGNWDSKLEDAQVDEAESTLKEALSLNYEEARALLGRLEYQKGNFDAALQVFQGIDIRTLSPRMSKAIELRLLQQKSRSKGQNSLAGLMSLHSVSLLLEAVLLKAKSLEELGRIKEAAKECKMILDVVDSALPNGMPGGAGRDCKMQEMFHKALDLLPKLLMKAGSLEEAVTAYRRTLAKPWNLDPERLANVQKELASLLIYGGVETSPEPLSKISGAFFPKDNMEEAILLLSILIQKVVSGDVYWDPEVIEHLAFALTISGQCVSLADHLEQVLPGTYHRYQRWYFLALSYSAAGQNKVAIDLLKKVAGSSENKDDPRLPSFMLGAKLCSQDPKYAHEGICFARSAIYLAINQNEHLLGQAYKYLGICCGNAKRMSMSDNERMYFGQECLKSLKLAAKIGKEDPEVCFNLGLQNAIQRNLGEAFSNAMMHSEVLGAGSVEGWKLLALILSAEQRFKDAEAIVDLALDETSRIEQLELLRLKAHLQTAEEQRKQAIETYRILLGLIQSQTEHGIFNTTDEEPQMRQLEVDVWLDLAKIYSDLESWRDAEICIDKAKATDLFNPRVWYITGILMVAQENLKEALVAFSESLSIEPDYVPSMVSKAGVLMKIGRPSLPIARSLLMNAVRIEPTNHDAWLHLGLLSQIEGARQQAADYFQAAHELKLSAPVQNFV